MSKVNFNNISGSEFYPQGTAPISNGEKSKINSVFGSSSNIQIENNEQKENTNQKDKITPEQIQSQIFDCSAYDERTYTKAIQSITSENILQVFQDGCNIGVHSACYGDSDKIIQWRSEDKILQDLKYIRKVFQDLCKQNGIDTTELDKKEFVYSNDSDIANYDSENLLDKYLGTINDNKYLKDKIVPLFNEDNSKKLESAIETRYNSAIKNNEKLEASMPNNMDFGNGKLDKITQQRGDNCWICAGLNSFATTSEGRAFLEKNIKRDDSRHIIAVYLRGAQKAHLPKPNGDGVYTFSDSQIAHGQKTLASGDGDFTAYNLAIEQYRKESGNYQTSEQERDVISGGRLEETYEILTGLNSNENQGDIGLSTAPKDYRTLLSMIKNGKGTACLADEDHAYSVVGVSASDELLIQESNQNPDWDKNKRFELVKNSNPPTYKLTKEEYEEYFLRCADFQWSK